MWSLFPRKPLASERQRPLAWEPLYPSTTPIALKKPPAAGTGRGGPGWGCQHSRPLGITLEPLGRGLTSSQFYKTPGGFHISSNGRTCGGGVAQGATSCLQPGLGPVLFPTCCQSLTWPHSVLKMSPEGCLSKGPVLQGSGGPLLYHTFPAPLHPLSLQGLPSSPLPLTRGVGLDPQYSGGPRA